MTDTFPIEGFAAIYDEADLNGDVVAPGAFRKSLAKTGAKAVKLLYQHTAEKPVGRWLSFEERPRGLYARGELLLATETAREVDATHSESNGWRELLGAAGVRQCSVAGAGVFLNDAAAESVRSAFFAGEIRSFRLVIPGMGELAGPFLIANLDYAGDYDGEATFSLALASAGAVSFTAAP